MGSLISFGAMACGFIMLRDVPYQLRMWEGTLTLNAQVHDFFVLLVLILELVFGTILFISGLIVFLANI